MIYTHLMERDRPVGIHVCCGHKSAPGYRILNENLTFRYGRGHGGPHKCYLAVAEGETREHDWHMNTAIMFVSREVYAEAVKVLYSSTAFNFTTTTYLRRFLEAIGTERSACLRHIMLKNGALRNTGAISHATAPAAFKLLRSAVNLRGLHLDHWEMCNSRNHLREHWRQRHGGTVIFDCDWLAESIRPLLLELRRSYRAQGLRLSVFEVVRVSDAFASNCGCHRGTNWWTVPPDQKSEETVKFNRLLAAKLGIEFTDDICAKLKAHKHYVFD